MADETQVFQKKALAKLHSPERQDMMFSIVPPLGWGVIIVVAVVLVSVLIWSFFGIMAEKVVGYGMLLDPAGSVAISSTYGGQIKSILFKRGDRVWQDDLVAVIDQPQLLQDVYYQVEQTHSAQSEAGIAGQTAQTNLARENHLRQAVVLSPFNGIITNVRIHEGDIITPGQAIYDLRQDQEREDIIAVVFVGALEGSKITEGSSIQISPGAFDVSETGSLVGKVIDVSEYPVTSDRIVYWTGNKEFANWVLQKNGGSVLEVVVELIKDDDTPSGYLWTSIKGADRKIMAGMTCTAQAIVKREAPIVKAFNKLSQWLRSD